jgi:hypothetical protein
MFDIFVEPKTECVMLSAFATFPDQKLSVLFEKNVRFVMADVAVVFCFEVGWPGKTIIVRGWNRNCGGSFLLQVVNCGRSKLDILF